MTGSRDLLVEATDDEDKFLEILQKHHARDDPFDLGEVLATLDKKLLEKVWSNLQSKFTGVLLTFQVEHQNDEEKQEFEKCCSVIQGIVTIAMETITLDDLFIPKELLETAIILHGILLSLPETLDRLRNGISRLCEAWWKHDLICRQELATQTITYLLHRSHQVAGTGADVKRVLQMHEILNQVDFNNESSANLQKLLEQAAVSMLYLKSEDGRRFLSHLFNLSPSFTESMHKTIKNHLPWCPKAILTFYGEVYFRAWKNAIGPNLEKLETGCIQDYMYHAMLAQPKLSSSIRKLLGYFHGQKSHRGLDEMLVRLYEPILWRHLRVANGQVRLHAVSLLMEAFPLQNPEDGVEEKDLLMQRQFDVFKDMLFDPYPAVRTAVVLGVCAICKKYWELIPPQTVKDNVNSMVSELAFDGASSDVRAAVFRGLTELIDNPLTHPMLKVLLPEMSNCFHDVSEKVRVAFVDMLLKVKGVKAIKFWNVVPLEHLLARLEVDPPPVARRLVKLLLNSYLPADKEQDVLVTRCISLVQANPGAARRFYQYVIQHSSIGNMVRLMATIFNLLEGDLQKRLEQIRNSPGGTTSGVESVAEPDFLESFGEENTRDNTSSAAVPDATTNHSPGGSTILLLDNLETVAGVLEVAVILLTGLQNKLNTNANKELRLKLEQKTSKILPGLFKVFQDSRILSSLLLLSGFIPAATVPTVSCGMFSRLRQMTCDTPPEDFVPMLEVMCKWGKVRDVLELISDWLKAGLQGNQTPEPKTRRSKCVSFAVPVEPQPMLALDFLSHLLQQNLSREVLLNSAKTELRDVAKTLHSVLRCIEQRMQSPDPLGELTTDKFLTGAFEMYLKLEILLHDQENRDHNAITVTEQLLSWADVEIISTLRKKKVAKKNRRLLGQGEMTLLSDPSSEGATLGSQQMATLSETALGQTCSETLSGTLLGVKRSAGEGGDGLLKQLVAELIQRLLTVTTNMLMVGIGDHELASHLADFAMLLLKIGDSSLTHLLPQICKLMYQITELTLTLNTGGADDEGVGSQGDFLPNMICRVIEMVVKLTCHKREQAERILPLIKPALAEMLSIYYRHHSLNHTLHCSIIATITEALVRNMTEKIQEDNQYEQRKTIQELPILASFLLTLIWRRTSLVGLLLEEVGRRLSSGEISGTESITGTCHMINTMTQHKRSISELKNCVMALETQTEQQVAALENELEDSPSRQLLKDCNQMISECKTRIGMV